MSLDAPKNIKCIKGGEDSAEKTCSCWDAAGEPVAAKHCHSPATCLIKGSDKSHGDFHYTALAKGDSIRDWMQTSGVPKQMQHAFIVHAAVAASDFTPFKYVVANGKAGTAKTYVGVARAFNNTRQLAIAYGTEDAGGNSLVQPMRCDSSDYPHAVKRDFTDDDIHNIAAGCEMFAWKAAAAKAVPQEAAYRKSGMRGP